MNKLTLGLMVLMLAATGCGKDHAADAAKAMRGLNGVFGTSASAALRQQIRQARDELERQTFLAEARREQAEVERLLQDGSIEDNMTSSCGLSTSTTYTATTSEGQTFTCTLSCPTSTALKYACDITGEVSQKCGAETFVFNGGSIAVQLGVTSTTAGTTTTSKVDYDSTYNTSFKGGETADFAALSCTLKFSVTISFDTATNAYEYTASIDDCSGFSCSIDGSEIACEDMNTAYSETACNQTI